jgi:archaellum component FlaC
MCLSLTSTQRFKKSYMFFQTIQSFRNLSKTIQSIKSKLNALNNVLESLQIVVNSLNIDFLVLKLPL